MLNSLWINTSQNIRKHWFNNNMHMVPLEEEIETDFL